jgi:hypothetical protein
MHDTDKDSGIILISADVKEIKKRLTTIQTQVMGITYPDVKGTVLEETIMIWRLLKSAETDPVDLSWRNEDRKARGK